ncbi:hypothetical protein ARMSODRAFT_983545 [Armillaria solidipes]|uniref:Uncharacterized protein n=1 Tax=Armillaria solidipes TaxID=1076256 RepID=A0A2H3AM35_9AGAR|nr:hypothetical protein ARMSODRAFT_983545 [Armillaria solidipes]
MPEFHIWPTTQHLSALQFLRFAARVDFVFNWHQCDGTRVSDSGNAGLAWYPAVPLCEVWRPKYLSCRFKCGKLEKFKSSRKDHILIARQDITCIGISPDEGPAGNIRGGLPQPGLFGSVDDLPVARLLDRGIVLSRDGRSNVASNQAGMYSLEIKPLVFGHCYHAGDHVDGCRIVIAQQDLLPFDSRYKDLPA